MTRAALQPARHECIFEQCPNPDLCRASCFHAEANAWKKERPREPVPLFQYDHDAEPADHARNWGRYPFVEPDAVMLERALKSDADETILIITVGCFVSALLVMSLLMLWVGE